MSLFEGLEKLYQVAKRNPGKTVATVFGTGAAITAGVVTAPVSLPLAGLLATGHGLFWGGAAGGMTRATIKGIEKLQDIQAQRRAAEEQARADAELEALIEEEAQAARELEALEQFEREQQAARQQAEIDAYYAAEAERDAYYQSLAEEYETELSSHSVSDDTSSSSSVPASKISGPMDRFLQPLSPSYDPFAELNVHFHAQPSSSSMMSSSSVSDDVQQPALTPMLSESSSSSLRTTRHRAKRTSSEEAISIQNKAIGKPVGQRAAARKAQEQIAEQLKRQRR